MEKYSHDKSNTGEHSNHDCDTLRNALEMQLEDTMCKLIRTEEDMSPRDQDYMTCSNSIEEYMHYHKSSVENVTKRKDKEIERLKYASKFIIFL